METAPCPHCGTPNLTNLVVCYYCGRRLTTLSEAIPDELPEYQPAIVEAVPSTVRAASGFAATLFAIVLMGFMSVGLLALIYIIFVFFLFLGCLVFPLYFLLAAFIPLYFQFFWTWGVTNGPRFWLKAQHWCDEVNEHFQKVKAGE